MLLPNYAFNRTLRVRVLSLACAGGRGRLTLVCTNLRSGGNVRDILSSNVSASELRKMLLLRRNNVEQTLAVESLRLHHIETRIAQLESEGALSADDVVVRAEPVRRLISLRRTVPSFSAARELILHLHTHTRQLLPKGRPSMLVAIAHSPQFEQDEIDVEFGYVLEDGVDVHLPEGSALVLRELESVERMEVCVRVGLPEDAHLVTAKIGRFVEASGGRLAGPTREVFLQPPDLDRMHEAVVEMQFPIQPRATARAATPNSLC
jgi:hypothetical protein